MRKSILSGVFLSQLSLFSSVSAHDHLDDRYKREDVVSSACRGYETFWSRFPGKLEAIHVSSGKLFRSIERSEILQILGGAETGSAVLETHTLSDSSAKYFAKVYEDTSSGRRVSSTVIGGMLGLVPTAGTALSAGWTFLDFVASSTNESVSLDELAILMRYGGKMNHVVSFWKADASKPWITYQTFFETTVNSKRQVYLLCALSYPLQIK